MYLYGKDLKRVEHFRFLGVFLIHDVHRRNHIGNVVDGSKKVMNIMTCLAGKGWGTDMASLKKIYVYMIRSRMDYGSLVYGSPPNQFCHS